MGLIQILKGEQPGPIKSLMNYENLGQFGEYVTEYALTNDNIDGKMIVLKNLILPLQNKTTEIDLIMIHEKGIFVFESKNYSGWIFGDIDQLNWTQSLPSGEKNKFYNPVRQNQTHIKALSSVLDKPVTDFISYIVFSERCTLKQVPDSTENIIILRRPNMLRKLRTTLASKEIKYTHDEVEEMGNKLKTFCDKTNVNVEQHIENIKTKCPFCGNDLVLRTGKYGQFWGCSAYPKCKFTRSEK